MTPEGRVRQIAWDLFRITELSPATRNTINTITKAVDEARADELNRCCEAIRAQCRDCKGSGNSLSGGGRIICECGTCGPLISAIRKSPAESKHKEPRPGEIDQEMQRMHREASEPPAESDDGQSEEERHYCGWEEWQEDTPMGLCGAPAFGIDTNGCWRCSGHGGPKLGEGDED